MLRWTSPSRPTLLQGFLAVASARGWFAEEGVELRVAAGAGTADAVAAVARGDAELGMSAPLASCPAIARGAPVVSIAQVAYRGFFEIASDRVLRRAEDLQGLRIGVVSAGGGTAQQLDAISLAAGLDPRGVAHVVTGLGLDGLAALRRGEVDGFFVFYETREALDRAGEALHYLAIDELAPMPGGAILARTDLVASRPDALRAVLRACVRGLAAMRDPSVAAEVLALQPAAARTLLDDAAALRVLARLRPALAPPSGIAPGAMDEAAWTRALSAMAGLGLLGAAPPQLGAFMTNDLVPARGRDIHPGDAP
jgi:NitT/TauT family transport system substrate-binding protein